MLASSAAFAATIDTQDYEVTIKLSVTLPGGIYPDLTLTVTEAAISAAMTTDLPDQSRMQVGYPQMTATFTLAGLVDPTDESRTAAWLFRRYNTASPLYRKDALMSLVTIDVGLYPAGTVGVPELIRKFTGVIDSYVESEDNSVAFSCVDYRALLRSIPAIPAIVSTAPFTADVTMAQILAAATTNWPFALVSSLDTSLNTLHVAPPIEAGTDPFTVFQQMCDAELGVAGFDESGKFWFRNRNTIKAIPVARTITSTTSLMSLQVETLAAAVINRAQVGYTTWIFGAAATVYSLGVAWKIPKHTTVVRTVTTDTLVVNVSTSVLTLPGSGFGTTGLSYVRVSTDAAGSHSHPGITVTVAQINSAQIRVTMVNTTALDAYLVASADDVAPPAGTPVLQIGGQPVTPANEVTTDYQYPATGTGAAGTRFGEVAWSTSGNPWNQDADSAAQLGRDVVLDGYVPRPNLTNMAIVPDPRLQLADSVHVQDADLTYVDEYARVFGWALSMSGSDWSMTVDARTLAPPGAWILGIAGRSELALTTYLQGV